MDFAEDSNYKKIRKTHSCEVNKTPNHVRFSEVNLDYAIKTEVFDFLYKKKCLPRLLFYQQ